jgi:hypothetical protein
MRRSENAAGRARERQRSSPETFESRARRAVAKEPVVAIAAAAALGWLLGRLLRRRS